MVRRAALIAAALLLSAAATLAAPAGYPLENRSITGMSTGYWHLEHLGDRMWLVAPDGNADFMRSVALFDSQPSGASGRIFRSYDKVILVPSGGANTDATAAAEDTSTSVLIAGQPYTLKNVGDAIYIGSARFRPEYTFFQMKTSGVPGAGGAILWSYYSNSASSCAGAPPCWVQLNGTGKPAAADMLNAAGSFYFDVGSESGTGVANGFYLAPADADIVQWFPLNASASAWPADFLKAAISSLDQTGTYWWIKGVVTGASFSTAPVVLQIAEEPTVLQTLAAKYGNSNSVSAAWANNDGSFLIGKGWNAAGQYSYRYVAMADPSDPDNQRASLSAALPLTGFPKVSDLAMAIPANRLGLPHPIKNDYVGLADNEACGGAEVVTPDVFDPHYFTALVRSLEYTWGLGSYWGNGNHPPDAGYYFAIVLEEADDLAGLNRLSHEHLGFMIAAENPYHPSDPTGTGVASYSDPVLYSKLALRDFLRNRYKTVAALNLAWDTAYTTWDTSSGCVQTGTNAWGWGSGLLDENGAALLAGGSCACAACAEPDDAETYNEESRWFANTAIQKDLDDFVAYYATQYGQTVRAALNYVVQACATGGLAGCASGLNLPPVFVPLYDGPDQGYTAIAPYVDGFWINPGEPASCPSSPYGASCAAADAQRIANDAGDKALVIQDYSSSGLDSPLSFRAAISSATYDAGTGTSSIVLSPATPYWYGSALPVEFPDASGCPAAQTTPSAVAWDQPAGTTTLTVAGNYATCLSGGNHVEIVPAPYMDAPNRAAMGAQMAARVSAVMNLANGAGARPVVGIEHWDLYDEMTFSGNGPGGAAGLATGNDDFYDGTETAPTACTDPNGYPCGGEEAAYGNLFGDCASAGTLCDLFSNIYSVLQ
jgi:hypothetical protein